MRAKHILLATALPQLSAALKHPLEKEVFVCTQSQVAVVEDKCDSFAQRWALSVLELEALNPGITCAGLEAGRRYCIDAVPRRRAPAEDVSASSPSPAAATPPSASTRATAPPHPSPTQPGLVPDCDGFHLVVDGDQCEKIEAQFRISKEQFRAWNPSVNEQCTNLWLGYYVCIHAPEKVPPPSSSSTSSPTPTPTKPANGIETPRPTQPGMIGSCAKFRLIRAGDTCDSVARAEDVSLEDFTKWNPRTGPDCTSLMAGAYACVGVIAPSQ